MTVIDMAPYAEKAYNGKTFAVNRNMNNVALKFNVIDDDRMRAASFERIVPRDGRPAYWCHDKRVKYMDLHCSLVIRVYDDGSWTLDVLDNDFCQPYDYQAMLERDPTFVFAGKIRDGVEQRLAYLRNQGILENWDFGAYV